MIVAPRYVFVHVPKSAGSSVTVALGGKTPGYATHTPLRHIEKGGRFAFGFVRNPWSRLVSLYRFMCSKTMRPTDAFDQQAVRDAGFRRWLTDPDLAFWMQEDEGWRTPDLPPMQQRPQRWWLDGCDFIGRAENIDDDWRRVCEMVGMPHRPLPHVNRTDGSAWRAEYDEPARAFVAEHFAADIERFGYRFCDF